MRLKSLVAAAAAFACVGLATPDTAAALGYDRDKPHGWGTARDVHHWVYYPRYVHHYQVDPYAYQYSPRGYYPYYGSIYWRPAQGLRERNHKHYHHWNVQPPRFKYYPGWGYPKHWRHNEWHKGHHGYHHRWHW
jgi:hypothetical protein